VALGFDQPVVWTEALASQFYLDGEKGNITSGSVTENVLTLKLAAPSTAQRITISTANRGTPPTSFTAQWHRRADVLRCAVVGQVNKPPLYRVTPRDSFWRGCVMPSAFLGFSIYPPAPRTVLFTS